MSENEAKPAEKEKRPSFWHTVLDRTILRRRARRKRRRQIRLLVIVALVAALAGSYLYMTSDRQVERLVTDYLEGLFHGRVEIHKASFRFFGGLQIEGIRIVLEDPERPVFQAERLRLTHDPLALLFGRLKVSELVAEGPRINLEQQDGQWNFQRMFTEAEPTTEQRPAIYVEDGVLSVRQLEGGRVVYEHALEVSGVIQPDASRPGVFTFFAGEVGSGAVHGTISRGMIDVPGRQVSFEGQAVNVTLSKQVAETLPPEARAIWDRFTPEGQVSLRVSFGDQRVSPGDTGFRVEVNLNGVSLAYAHQGRTFRLRDFTGQCVIDAKTLELRNVHGVLTAPLAPGIDGAAADGLAEEISLAVSLVGQVTGLDDRTFGQHLRLDVEDLDVARLGPLAADVWNGGANFYRKFQPSGRADVMLQIDRAAAATGEAPMQFSGTIHLRDGRVVNEWFPYPAENLSGTIALFPDHVDIVDLRGRQGAARVTVSGRIGDPDGPAETVDLTLQGQNLTLDNVLREAIAKGFPEQLALYDSLHPAGQVDVKVRVTEDLGKKQKLDAVAEIALRGAEVRYEVFPYRIRDGSGFVRIAGDRVDLDVRGRHGPAQVAVRGDISWAADAPQEEATIRLEVTGTDVPLDEDLAAALPEEQRAIYNEYHLSGRADMAFAIASGKDTAWQVTHRGEIELKNVGLVFEAFPFPIEGIQGRIELAPDTFLIKDLRGTNAEAALSATGNVARRGESYAVDLTIRGRSVLLDRDLRGAIAMVAPELWANLSAEGRVNVTCHLVQQAEPGSRLAAAVTLDAEDISVEYKHFPYPLRHCRGRMTYEGNRVTIENLENTEGATRIRAAGAVEIGPSGSFQSRLAMKAVGVEIDDALIEALPETFGKALRALAVRGRVSVHLDELTYDMGTDGKARASWRGSAVLDNAAIDLGGVPLDRVVAYVQLQGTFDGEDLALEGSVDMPQGRIDDKEITHLRAELHKTSGSPRVTLTRLEGDLYGGRIELDGDGQLIFGDPARYGLAVRIRDVDFQRFVREGLALEAPIEGGRMSGEFALWGSGADADSAHARIAFQVRQAQLYQLPAVIQVLNALRLGGSAKTFEEADVTMFLRQRSYIIEEILLRGQGLSVHGAGRIDPQGRLDLLFATGPAPGGGVLAALSELAEGLRRELVLVEVTGTTRRPEVHQRSFEAITAPLKELLGAVEESRKFREEQQRRKRASQGNP